MKNKKNISEIPMAGSTIVHSIIGKHGSSRVLLKPAAPGTGVIAGGAARQVLEVAGVKDILAKSLGSPTHLNVAKATINGLLNQRTPDSVASLRGKKSSEVAPPGLVEAYEKTKAEKKLKVSDEIINLSQPLTRVKALRFIFQIKVYNMTPTIIKNSVMNITN